ncbi:MAG: hypothetical protein DI636_08830 [Pelagerythrobacter marensis]|nr:MAG: hypothetical protein DI636_08830 [Pelagerythrobacter marensis]
MIRRAALLAAAAMLAPLPLAAQDAAPAPATTATPLPSAHGYQPQDELERGLWYEMAEQERLLRQSHFLVDDPALNAYVRGVLCRTVGAERCAATRLYLVRTPFFNASMAPNGAMIVNTGLLLRMRDEAQLAAVLGHEFTHFEHQHSLRLFRNMRTKTDILSIFSLAPIPYAAGMVGQIAILSSVFGFNREMEREADAGSIAELARAGGRHRGRAAPPQPPQQQWRPVRHPSAHDRADGNARVARGAGGGKRRCRGTARSRISQQPSRLVAAIDRRPGPAGRFRRDRISALDAGRARSVRLDRRSIARRSIRAAGRRKAGAATASRYCGKAMRPKGAPRSGPTSN